LTGSGVTVIGSYGPSVLLRAGADGDRGQRFAGVLLRHGDHRYGPFPYLYVDAEATAGPLLGDLDLDRDVDADDLTLIRKALADHGPAILPGDDGWQPRLDVNLDRRIDQVDVAIETKITS
jgi:hypothetical protein